jgi:hypothetical protein
MEVAMARSSVVGRIAVLLAALRARPQGVRGVVTALEAKPAWRRRHVLVFRPRGARRASPIGLLGGTGSEMAA